MHIMELKSMSNKGKDRRWLEATPYTFEELLNEKGYLVYTNVGTSMLPLLRQRRDIIEIRKKPPGHCHKYDVVLYKRGEKYILHRVLRVLQQGYIIAGDHNTFLETDVTDDMILGIMTRVIRDGRSITPDNLTYRVYVLLWCGCYPVRMALLRVRSRAISRLSRIPLLHKIYHLIKRRSRLM